MKIEFLTQDDSNYILPFFDEFVRQYGDEFDIHHVSCCRAMGKRSRSKLFLELLWLYGAFGFLRLGLRTAFARLMAKLPAREKGRAHSIAQLCRTHRIPYEEVKDPNSADFLAGLKERAPDLIVSVACPYILKASILHSTPLGCINIHSAPLPKYKGMMPVFWQMYHGEKKIGVTIHYMAAKVDEGDGILQEDLEIKPGESLDALIRRSKRYGAHCMAKVLNKIRGNNIESFHFDQEESTYFSFPTREQIQTFRNRGFRAI